MKYVALLRGINVGGNKKVPMDDLKEYFLNIGFLHVTTLLNTGNVLFESDKKLDEINSLISELLDKHFDFHIPYEIITENQLIEFIGNKAVVKVIREVEKGQKIIFTFATNLCSSEISQLKKSEEFELVYHNTSILCLHFSVDKIGTPSIMKSLDSALKKRGTSRNLNTVLKIRKKLEAL